MKFEYLPATETEGPRYILRPQSPEDQRICTVWHNLALSHGVLLEPTGAERNDKDTPGLPPRPVVALELTVVDRHGVPMRGPAGKENNGLVLDPTKMSKMEANTTQLIAKAERTGKVNTAPQATGTTIVTKNRLE